MTRSNPQIRLESISKSFNDQAVLRSIDLEVQNGEIVAIVGGSGCGKSVLLEIIIGLLRPNEGRVLIADHALPGAPLVELSALTADELDALRRHWAVVFQRNALLSGTVRENLEFWLRENSSLSDSQREARVRESLERVGFSDLDDLLLKKRHELSGGMAKRVAIARAIAMDPAIIFYDEPTTGLDPVLAKQIHALIAEIHGTTRADGVQRTSIVITHDKDLLARIRPRVVMLHGGVVAFDGPYEDFACSDSPDVMPYFEQMPGLQATARR